MRGWKHRRWLLIRLGAVSKSMQIRILGDCMGIQSQSSTVIFLTGTIAQKKLDPPHVLQQAQTLITGVAPIWTPLNFVSNVR